MASDRPGASTLSAAMHAVLRVVPLVLAALAVPRLLDRLGAHDVSFAPPEYGGSVAGDEPGGGARPPRGFGISVASVPAGARVVVDGVDVGDSPLVAPVACAPGAPVRVELRKPPYRAEERVETCRAEGLVQLSIVLGR